MYEYVALKCSTAVWSLDRGFASAYCRLREEGWEEYIRAYFHNDIGGTCIMRRPKDEPQDEPRLWTEAEVKKIATLVMDCRVPVLNERAMQADLCGRLEKRNAELQAAIDKVVGIESRVTRGPGLLQSAPRLAIRNHLSPLASPRKHQGHADATATAGE